MHKLHYISQGEFDHPFSHIRNIESVLDAGVVLVQLRLKNVTEFMYQEFTFRAKELCDKYNATLLVNDNPAVAAFCKVGGFHLGLNDMAITEAKKIAPGLIVGGTANTFEHIKQRCEEKVDYIGLGPFRFTTTKEKLSPILGATGYHDIIAKMKAENLNIPVYAIGGIELNDIEEIMKTGVYGIAVSGLLTKSNNKEQLVKEINKLLYHA